jgi:hypothetical protein
MSFNSQSCPAGISSPNYFIFNQVGCGRGKKKRGCDPCCWRVRGMVAVDPEGAE